MIYWMLTVVLAVACVLAATLTDFRKVVLSVWCAQLSFGGLALQMGSSYLALLVWILGTLCAVVLLAYGSVFGDLFCKEPATQLSEGHQEGATPRTWPAILLPLGGLTAALFFSALVLFAVSEGAVAVKLNGVDGKAGIHGDLYQFGIAMSSEPSISAFSIGVLFLIGVFGLGVVTRPRRMKDPGTMNFGREAP